MNNITMQSFTQKIISGTLMLGMMIIPSISFAEQTKRPMPQNERRMENFCSTLEKRGSDFSKQFNQRFEKINNLRDTHLTKVMKQRETRDTNRSQHQANKQDNLTEKFKALDALAVTDAQKNAVAEFKKTIQDAITLRQTTIHDAVTEFRTAADNLREDKKGTIDTLMTTFQTERKAIYDKAVADCASGIDAETVRNSFTSSLEELKSTFVSERKDTELHTKILELQENRKNDVQQAITTFKETVEEARKLLESQL
jgi:hypothetical protein